MPTPPLVGFGFTSPSVRPPAGTSEKRKRNCRRQAGDAQPWQISLRPSRRSLADRSLPELPHPLSQQSQAVTSLQPPWLNRSIVCSPAEPLPAATGSPVGSRHVGAGRSHSFCSRWLFYPSEWGYRGSRLFPLGAIAGEQCQDVAGSRGERDPGDGLLALPITR